VDDDAPDELTPPGPPVEPEPPSGGLSMDDWIAAQRGRPDAGPAPDSAPPFAPPPSLYGQGYGGSTEWKALDLTSVTGFALSLTGIASPVGVVLGAIGLRRTSDGTRAGRWAAILAIVVGIVASLGMAAAVAGTFWFRDNIKTVDRVETGACVDLDDEDGVLFYPRDCTVGHEAEVVATGTFRGRAALAIINARPADFCFKMTDDGYREAARTGEYSVTLVISADDPRDPGPDDSYACIYRRSDLHLLRDRITAGDSA
jgi:hypothetical protein